MVIKVNQLLIKFDSRCFKRNKQKTCLHCKSNLKYHIMRANYVANMYIKPVRLNKCLKDSAIGEKMDVINSGKIIFKEI